MKKLKFALLLLIAAVTTVSLQSCNDNDDNYEYGYPTAIVTVKTNPTDKTCYLQLNDETTLFPKNMAKSPFGDKEVRAFVNYTKDNQTVPGYSQSVKVNWIDSIVTKPMAIDKLEDNIKIYGNDPLEIVNSWETVVEDGYFTIRFRTYFGNRDKHVLNLVKGKNDYEVVLYHDAKEDFGGYVADGVIAFRLDQLPDTNGETVDLTLRWKSFSGEKAAVFKYKTRK